MNDRSDFPIRQAGSFLGAPQRASAKGAQAAILGIPFDCGRHPTRIGSRLGPAAIRAQSPLVLEQLGDAGIDVIGTLGLVDCGDAAVTPGLIEPSFAAIEAAVAAILAAGATPVTMGGDGAVTLPQLRALHRNYPKLALLHLDAHTDAYRGDGVDRYNNATTFTRAAEEGLLDIEHSIHAGTRGAIDVERIVRFGRKLGYEVIEMAALRERGIEGFLDHVRQRLAGRSVYLCFDMDFFDPSVAPGVCTPTWGGVTAAEGLAILRGLGTLDIVAVDVNTVSPPHDPTGMTAFLAGQVMTETLALFARRRLNR
jgi:agmatinase